MLLGMLQQQTSAAEPFVWTGELLNEAGIGTITSVPGLRVRIDGGSWQTLPAAGLSISRTASDTLTVTGLAGTETTVEFVYEDEIGFEPYRNAGNALDNTVVDALYATHPGEVPQTASLPGLPVIASFDPVVAT